MKFTKPTTILPTNITQMSTPMTKQPKTNLKKSKPPTTSSTTTKNKKSSTSTTSTPTKLSPRKIRGVQKTFLTVQTTSPLKTSTSTISISQSLPTTRPTPNPNKKTTFPTSLTTYSITTNQQLNLHTTPQPTKTSNTQSTSIFKKQFEKQPPTSP